MGCSSCGFGRGSHLASCPFAPNQVAATRDALAAMQARAEKAEREAARLLDEQRRPTCNDCGVVLGDNWCADCAGKVHRDRIAALESRLAEVAPVVEAAERYAEAQADFVTKESLLWGPEGCAALLARNDAEFAVRKAAQRLRAARSLRGAGEGNTKGTGR